MTTTGTVSVRARVSDEAMAADVETWLTDKDAADVHRVREEGILPIVGAVIAGTVAVAGATTLVMWIRDKFACQQLVDARGDDVEIVTDCDHRNGKIIVIADKGQVVSITDPPDVFDITEVAKTALSSGADVAKAAIEAAGGEAKVEPNPDPPAETITV